MSYWNLEAKARARRAVENVLESEGLTAGLPDAQAQQLLGWGVARAEQAAAAGDELAPSQAGRALDEQLNALRKLMRSVTKLVADERPVDEERLRGRLERLAHLAARLGLAAGPEAWGALVHGWSALGVDEKLARLLAVLGDDGETDQVPG